MSELRLESEGSAGNSASQLLRAIGGWARPSGRGLHMFRSMMVASTSAALIGLGAACTAGVLGSAGTLGFLFGSCVGFIGGSIYYYRMAMMQALQALEDQPRLLQMHLVWNFPHMGFQRLSRDQLTRGYWQNGSAIRHSVLVAAYQSASSDLEQIYERRAQLLVDKAIEAELEST
ncbi:hypothetical protein HJFPF1_13169 [Paramyrothecium foliicola]|nr:hypothetical protein HJFPF1_13169 [Paramyrothecium foliicola]